MKIANVDTKTTTASNTIKAATPKQRWSQHVMRHPLWIKLAAVACASGLSLGVAAPAQANSWLTGVGLQLISASRTMGLGGYSLSHEPHLGMLSNRTYEDTTITLRAGVNYQLIAACDHDCRDVDLHLYDENGNLIDADPELDDYPIVNVTPKWSGQFTVRTSMANCDSNFCYYGVGVFSE